jgi:hypothetical protein
MMGAGPLTPCTLSDQPAVPYNKKNKINMENFSEPKRNYVKRTPEQIRADLQEKLNKMAQKEAVRTAQNRPELQPLIEAKNKLISEKNKNSVLLGSSTLGLSYKIRLATAKLSMLQARQDLVSYTSQNISKLVQEINNQISILALEENISPADLIAATSFEDQEYSRLLSEFQSAEKYYNDVKAERISKNTSNEDAE